MSVVEEDLFDYKSTLALSNQKEIIARLKILEHLLNQIAPKQRRYLKKKPEDLMGAAKAALFLGMGSSQFNRRAKEGDIPSLHFEGIIGRQYSKKELEEWITQRPKSTIEL